MASKKPRFRSGTAAPDLWKRGLQSAEWCSSAYSFQQLQILRLSSQSITRCCQSASSSSVCTKTRRKSFIHDTQHPKPAFLTDSDSQEWEGILLDSHYALMGQHFHSPFEITTHFHSSYSAIATEGYGCRFLQTFAEHSCDTADRFDDAFGGRLAIRQYA